MPDAREIRQQHIDRLLQSHRTVIACTANRPGRPKENLLANFVTYHFLQMLLADYASAALDTRVDACGVLGLLGVDLPAADVKNAMMAYEASPLGRLVDLDVYQTAGGRTQPLSRADSGHAPRRCFLCGDDAFACRRLERHDTRALQDAFDSVVIAHVAEQRGAHLLGTLAEAALWSELCRLDGFGSVTLNSNGSHTDMNPRLMLQGIGVIGRSLAALDRDVWMSFDRLREAGRRIERTLLEVTDGVNTHKGALFHILILTAALMRLPTLDTIPLNAFAESLSAAVKDIAEPLRHDLAAADALPEADRESLGHGLQSYLKYGHAGARQEALYGYETLLTRWLPRFAAGQELRPLLAEILHRTWDTTTLKRGGFGMLQTLRHMALRVGDTADLEALSRWCEERGLSTGGSADLIALLYYAYLIYRFRGVLRPETHAGRA